MPSAEDKWIMFWSSATGCYLFCALMWFSPIGEKTKNYEHQSKRNNGASNNAFTGFGFTLLDKCFVVFFARFDAECDCLDKKHIPKGRALTFIL